MEKIFGGNGENGSNKAFMPFPLYFQKLISFLNTVVGGFGKKNCVSTGVRKPGNTYASPTAMI